MNTAPAPVASSLLGSALEGVPKFNRGGRKQTANFSVGYSAPSDVGLQPQMRSTKGIKNRAPAVKAKKTAQKAIVKRRSAQATEA